MIRRPHRGHQACESVMCKFPTHTSPCRSSCPQSCCTTILLYTAILKHSWLQGGPKAASLQNGGRIKLPWLHPSHQEAYPGPCACALTSPGGPTSHQEFHPGPCACALTSPGGLTSHQEAYPGPCACAFQAVSYDF